MNTVRVKRFFTQPVIWQSLCLVILVLIVGIVLIYYRITLSDSLLILHYTIPFGIDLLGPWQRLYEIPIAGFVIALINYVLAYIFYTKQRHVAIALVFVTVVLSCMVTTGLYLILEQNII